jgi:hypothetical protein
MRDGMNEDGALTSTYNRIPYADYTGYAAVNTDTDTRVADMDRWQPGNTLDYRGPMATQRFLTPQFAANTYQTFTVCAALL